MEDEEIEIEVLINFKEYLKLNYTIAIRQLRFILIPLLPIFLCNFSTVLYFLIKGGSIEGNLVPLIFTSALLIVILSVFIATPIFIYFNSKRNLENQPFLNQKVKYIFAENQIEIKGNSFESKLNWEMILKAQEIAGFFILNNTSATALIIPLRCLREESQTNKFRELLKEKLGDKAKLKK